MRVVLYLINATNEVKSFIVSVGKLVVVGLQ